MTIAGSAVPVFDSRAVKLCCGGLIALYLLLWVPAGFLPLQDFGMLWAAGHLAATGHAAAVYDLAAIHAVLPVGAPFPYPPIFLLLLAPFGALPFMPAAALWLALTLGLYLAAIRAIVPGPTAALAALAAPPVLLNVAWGQNGLLLAALLGAGLALLDRRPLFAGVLFGLMAYKPHFGLLLPLFLAATRRWQAIGAAAATVLALLAMAALFFGSAAFIGFAQTLAVNNAALDSGRPAAGVTWSDLVSVFGVLRASGCTPAIAGATHVAVAGAAAAGSLWLAVSRARGPLNCAGLAVAAVLLPPYAEPADWSLLAVAAAFFVRDAENRPLHRGEVAGLALLFLLPLANLALRPVLHDAGLAWGWTAGPVVCAILAAMIGGRAMLPPREAAV